MSDEIICTCMGITANEIKAAYEKGACTVSDIQEVTGAGTVCGACVEEIERILDELMQKK